MGNAGSMDQHTDFRGHNMPLKLPMPEPSELEERFATVLVSKKTFFFHLSALCSLHASLSWDGTAVCWWVLFVQHACPLLFREKGYSDQK